MTEIDSEQASPVRASRRARSGKTAATIYDIATLAGVNPSTVSRALNKPGRINAKTEKLIQDAARELNYRVNPIARALPTGRTHTLGLILADITNPMFFQVVRGAERAAAQCGYTLILAESQESRELEAEAAERVTPWVDGLILVTTRLADDRIRDLQEIRPLVVINRIVDGIESIVPELGPGIDQALAHLAALGHTSIAYLSGPPSSWMSGARWNIIMQRAFALGMTIVEIGPNAPTLAGGAEAYLRVIASGVTAVMAYNDLMAIGLLRTAQEHEVTVPGRLSIMGFDDIFGSDFTSPQLTTIRIPLDLIGELAVRRALDQLGVELDETVPSDVELGDDKRIVTELVIRGSTGPVTI